MKTDICNVCSSSKIMEDITIVDFGHANTKNNLSVQIKTTNNFFFNKFEKGNLKAQICGSCGKVELKVDNPNDLWQAYLKTKTL